MKFYTTILALCSLYGASAFTMQAPNRASTTALKSAIEEDVDYLNMFPQEIAMQRIEGGGTVRTYQMPPDADRCQYVLKSEGRPLKCIVELWLGPLRRTHAMDVSVEDGSKTPFKATLKFRPGGPQVLRVKSSKGNHLPLSAGVYVPDAARRAELKANTEDLWERSEKTRIQGQSVGGGGSAVRLFPIAGEVEAVQVLIWARISKKSCKAMIEVLQGPNNIKQVYDLHLGGGSQPYHVVIETPGEGTVLRMKNKKFVEDGLFEVVVLPYKWSYASTRSMGGAAPEWWQ